MSSAGAMAVQSVLERIRLTTMRPLAGSQRPLGRADLGALSGRPTPAAAASARTVFDPVIHAAARRDAVDPALVRAIIQAESNFNPRAVSHAGAKGLMQLMDSTARSLGVANVFDPIQNIFGGVRYLRQLLDRYGGNEPLALAAYNAGPGAVDRFQGIPPYAETQDYVRRVLQLRGNAAPAAPDDWLANLLALFGVSQPSWSAGPGGSTPFGFLLAALAGSRSPPSSGAALGAGLWDSGGSGTPGGASAPWLSAMPGNGSLRSLADLAGALAATAPIRRNRAVLGSQMASSQATGRLTDLGPMHMATTAGSVAPGTTKRGETSDSRSSTQ